MTTPINNSSNLIFDDRRLISNILETPKLIERISINCLKFDALVRSSKDLDCRSITINKFLTDEMLNTCVKINCVNAELIEIYQKHFFSLRTLNPTTMNVDKRVDKVVHDPQELDKEAPQISLSIDNTGGLGEKLESGATLSKTDSPRCLALDMESIKTNVMSLMPTTDVVDLMDAIIPEQALLTDGHLNNWNNQFLRVSTLPQLVLPIAVGEKSEVLIGQIPDSSGYLGIHESKSSFAEKRMQMSSLPTKKDISTRKIKITPPITNKKAKKITHMTKPCWDHYEIERLIAVVKKVGLAWELVSKSLGDRTPFACKTKWILFNMDLDVVPPKHYCYKSGLEMINKKSKSRKWFLCEEMILKQTIKVWGESPEIYKELAKGDLFTRSLEAIKSKAKKNTPKLLEESGI